MLFFLESMLYFFLTMVYSLSNIKNKWTKMARKGGLTHQRLNVSYSNLKCLKSVNFSKTIIYDFFAIKCYLEGVAYCFFFFH